MAHETRAMPALFHAVSAEDVLRILEVSTSRVALQARVEVKILSPTTSDATQNARSRTLCGTWPSKTVRVSVLSPGSDAKLMERPCGEGARGGEPPQATVPSRSQEAQEATEARQATSASDQATRGRVDETRHAEELSDRGAVAAARRAPRRFTRLKRPGGSSRPREGRALGRR